MAKKTIVKPSQKKKVVAKKTAPVKAKAVKKAAAAKKPVSKTTAKPKPVATANKENPIWKLWQQKEAQRKEAAEHRQNQGHREGQHNPHAGRSQDFSRFSGPRRRAA